MRSVNRRRFALLAAVLVALNASLWLAQSGFALPQALINDLFGSRMIRAEVLVQAPDGSVLDYRVDRGVLVSVAGSTITLREANGDSVAIPVAPTAQVAGRGGRAATLAQLLQRKVRVLVFRQGNAPADTVQVEGVGG